MFQVKQVVKVAGPFENASARVTKVHTDCWPFRYDVLFLGGPRKGEVRIGLLGSVLRKT